MNIDGQEKIYSDLFHIHKKTIDVLEQQIEQHGENMEKIFTHVDRLVETDGKIISILEHQQDEIKKIYRVLFFVVFVGVATIFRKEIVALSVLFWRSLSEDWRIAVFSTITPLIAVFLDRKYFRKNDL